MTKRISIYINNDNNNNNNVISIDIVVVVVVKAHGYEANRDTDRRNAQYSSQTFGKWKMMMMITYVGMQKGFLGCFKCLPAHRDNEE